MEFGNYNEIIRPFRGRRIIIRNEDGLKAHEKEMYIMTGESGDDVLCPNSVPFDTNWEDWEIITNVCENSDTIYHNEECPIYQHICLSKREE